MNYTSNVSARFTPINTGELVERIHNTVGQGNITNVEYSQDRSWISLRLDDRITFGDGTSGNPTIFLRNRNDGATALQIHAGVFRVVCKNGLIIGAGYAQRVIHVAGPKLSEFLRDFDTAIQAGIELCYESEQKSHELIANTVGQAQAIQIIGSLPMPNKVKEASIDRVLSPLREVDSVTNVWSLYNTVNETNRQLSRSGVAAMEREMTLLQDIEALYQHQSIRSVA